MLDRSTATVTLESASVEGGPVNSDCSYPSISADGRYLAFATVVADDPDRSRDATSFFATGWPTPPRRITMAPGGALSNGWSSQPVVSANASAVVFTSAATNLVSEPDVNGPQPDIYRFDVGSGAIERISVDSRGVQQQGGSQMPSVSGDGRYVVFVVDCRPVRSAQRFRADAQPGTVSPRSICATPEPGQTTLVVAHRSCRTVGARWRRSARTDAPSPSPPAPRIWSRAIETRSSDVFLYDVDTRAVTLVSRGRRRPANGASLNPAISADGRFVAFQSDASDMACGRNCRTGMEDINLLPDVFIFDRVTGQISCLSLDVDGTWLEESGAPAIDASGTVVAFPSRHPISALDVLNDFDLFVRITPVAGESRAP